MDMETSPRTSNKQFIKDLVSRTESGNSLKDLWIPAVKFAREEKDQGFVDKIYPNIELGELIFFGEIMLQNNSIEDRYKLMLVNKTKAGKNWYDALLSGDNQKIFEPVIDFVKKKYWQNAADIGTGTGDTLRSIAPFCKKVHGIDNSKLSIEIAKDLGIPNNADILYSGADKLPFLNDSLDLVVSNGLIYYLSKKQTEDFVKELSRVIETDGKFYHSFVIREENEIVPQVLSQSLDSGKSALVNLVATIATGHGHPENLGVSDFNKLVLSNNFLLTEYKQNPDNRVVLEYTRK